jgi:glycosyltransferase involved in cell wall biosynthesis
MSLIEKIDSQKIFHINLGYDFNLYPEVNKENVASLRAKYSGDILLIVLGRLDKFKRPEIAINVLERLIFQHGLNAKLIFLGTGDLDNQLKKVIRKKGLCSLVFFPGFVENVLEYLAAGNFLFHPSISESSSVAIKEAALVNLPVIVCKNVGDFDEYLKDGINSFIINQDTADTEAANVIANNYKNTTKLHQMSFNLREEILKRFAIENVLPSYLKIISEG